MQENTIIIFAAEIVGTDILLFSSCMGCIGTIGSVPPSPLQMALTFGLTVNLIIMLGHISGAHLNPTVTISAIIVGVKSIPTGAVYILGQFIGATVGYGLLKIITSMELFNNGNANSTTGLCVTVHPGINSIQAILIKVFCTSCILCAVCAMWNPRCVHTKDLTALRFDFSVAAISFAASSYTGCSMNPARTFGPALWNSAWKNQWNYILHTGQIRFNFLGSSKINILVDKV